MAQLTYREAVARGIAQEMARDESVVFLGEDVAKAGGVFKATVGLLEQFGPRRVLDMPISEQAILGGRYGRGHDGLEADRRDHVRRFPGGLLRLHRERIPQNSLHDQRPGGLPAGRPMRQRRRIRFGAQHSQSVENWCMQFPGLKVVVPSSPVDVIGLLAAAVRDPDPVMFLEHKSLYAAKGEVPDGEIVDALGTAKVLRPGRDASVLALGLMVPRSLQAAERLQAEHGISCEVIDVRSLVPLDTQCILDSIARTGRVFTVEENPRQLGWGAEIVSIVSDEAFYDLDGPAVRITTPNIPLPAADALEDLAIPSVDRILETIRGSLSA